MNARDVQRQAARHPAALSSDPHPVPRRHHQLGRNTKRPTRAETDTNQELVLPQL
jgi:hypothetical protein